MKDGANPSPTIGMKIVKSASEGSVRNTLAIPSVISFATGRCRTRMPHQDADPYGGHRCSQDDRNDIDSVLVQTDRDVVGAFAHELEPARDTLHMASHW